MTYFTFNILSTTHTIFTGKIRQITLPGVKGKMTLSADHMPIISALSAGHVSVWLDESKDSLKVFPIPGGFVDMKDNKCIVFVNDQDDLLSLLLQDHAKRV
ncbi:MAG: hypothetical protein V4482_01420 [Pseudomonadota bacterium]